MDIFVFSLSYCFYTPFTKVEESFNIQAMHDILYHGTNIEKYDHLQFPGVVPRTFLGPLAVSITISPVVALFEYLGINKFWSQYLVRLTLAAFVVYGFQNLRRTISQKFGFPVTLWYTLITMSQFHFIFYMSRSLPNIFAMPLVLLAVNSWLRRENAKFIWFSGAAIILFRAELVLLLGLFLLFDIYYKRIDIKEFFKHAIPAAIVLVAATIAVDSMFWQRLVWPEAEVFWFNTILNKSSEWGTSPFFWYFYSAIPRAMGCSLLFLPLGLFFEPRIRSLVIPALVFIMLFSFLPHKELRFIIYTFPLLNVAVACACHRLWINRLKSIFHSMAAIVAGGHLVMNLLFTMFLLIVSGTNYPGGVAISRLHRLAEGEQNITIHIGNLAAQSGVTRFTEINANWTYIKTENLKPGDIELQQNDYLLAESKSKHSPEMKILQQTHDIVEFVDCFHNIGLQYKSLLPVRINTRPCIYILQKRDDADLAQLMSDALSFDSGEQEAFVELPVLTENKSVEAVQEQLESVEVVEEEVKSYADLLQNEDNNSTAEPSMDEEESGVADEQDIKETESNDPSTVDTEEEPVRLKRVYKSARAKLQELKHTKEEAATAATTVAGEPPKRAKSNIHKIIKTAKAKQMIDDLSKLDLNEYCDLS